MHTSAHLAIALALLACLLASTEAASVVRKRDFSVVWFTDIRLELEPTGRCAQNDAPYYSLGCDTSEELLDMILTVAGGRHDAVVLGGNFVPGYTNSSWNVSSTMLKITQKLRNRWDPHDTTYAISLGPLDYIPGSFFNFTAPEGERMTEGVGSVYRAYLSPFLEPSPQEKTLQGNENGDALINKGFYRRDAANDPVTFLMLNTVLLSRGLQPASAEATKLSNGTDPLGQLNWLREQLDELRQTSRWVVIVGSLPPGIDFNTNYYFDNPSKTDDYSTFYDEFQLEAYGAIVSNYSEIISAQLFGYVGHAHFRLIDGTVVYVGPAVSPSNYAQPSFSELKIDIFSGKVREWALTSYFKNNSDATIETTRIDVGKDVLQTEMTVDSISLLYKWLPRLQDRFNRFLFDVWNSQSNTVLSAHKTMALVGSSFMDTVEKRIAMMCAFSYERPGDRFKQCLGTCAPLFYVNDGGDPLQASKFGPIKFVKSRPFWLLTHALQLPFLIGVLVLICRTRRSPKKKYQREPPRVATPVTAPGQVPKPGEASELSKAKNALRQESTFSVEDDTDNEDDGNSLLGSRQATTDLAFVPAFSEATRAQLEPEGAPAKGGYGTSADKDTEVESPTTESADAGTRHDTLFSSMNAAVLLNSCVLGLWIAQFVLRLQTFDGVEVFRCYYKWVAFLSSICRPMLILLHQLQLTGAILTRNERLFKNTPGADGRRSFASFSGFTDDASTCFGRIRRAARRIGRQLVKTFGHYPHFSRLWVVACIAWSLWDVVDAATTDEVYSSTVLLQVDIASVTIVLMLLYFVGSYHAAWHYADEEAVVAVCEYASVFLQHLRKYHEVSKSRGNSGEANGSQSTSINTDEPRGSPSGSEEYLLLEATFGETEQLYIAVARTEQALYSKNRLAYNLSRETLPSLHRACRRMRKQHRGLRTAMKNLRDLYGDTHSQSSSSDSTPQPPREGDSELAVAAAPPPRGSKLATAENGSMMNAALRAVKSSTGDAAMADLLHRAEVEVSRCVEVSCRRTAQRLVEIIVSMMLACAAATMSVYSTTLMAEIVQQVTDSGFNAINDLSLSILKFDLVRCLLLVVGGEVLLTTSMNQLKLYSLDVVPTATQLLVVFLFLYGLDGGGKTMGALLALGVGLTTIFTMLGSVQIFYFFTAPVDPSVPVDSPNSAASLATPHTKSLWRSVDTNSRVPGFFAPLFKGLLLLTSLVLIVIGAVLVFTRPEALINPNDLIYAMMLVHMLLFMIFFGPLWVRKIVGADVKNFITGSSLKRTLMMYPDNADMVCRVVGILMWYVMVRYWLTSNGNNGGLNLQAMTVCYLAQRRLNPLPFDLRVLFQECVVSDDLERGEIDTPDPEKKESRNSAINRILK